MESNEQGSTFWFSLPFEDAVVSERPVKDTEPPKQPFSVLQEKKILLTEDDLVNRALITKMLEQQGTLVVAVIAGLTSDDAKQSPSLSQFDALVAKPITAEQVENTLASYFGTTSVSTITQ